MIDRRDIRVLVEGWYEFKIDQAEEVISEYGPAVRFLVSVCRGRAEGARMVIQVDRVATSGNKTGRILAAIGFCPSVELPVETQECVGRKFGGRVQRYYRDGRVRGKVVEFCAAERVREKIESYAN